MVFRTDFRLMQIKSIAECSKGSILQYVSYSLSLRPLFCLFLSDRLRQVLLYVIQLQDDPDRHLNNRTHFSIDLSYLYSIFAEKIKEFMEKIVQDKLGWHVEGI